MTSLVIQAMRMRICVDIMSSVSLGKAKGPLFLELHEGSTVNDLLRVLLERDGGALRPRLVSKRDGKPFVAFIVNGELVGLEQTLAPNDEVLIFPPIAGGR